MAWVPTPDELRRKADETRDEAKTFETLELREHIVKIAAEYERLAARAEAFEERARLGAGNAHALEKWLE